MRVRYRLPRVILLLAACVPAAAYSQVFAPGQFSIDGIPVSCGSVSTIVDATLKDVGQNDMQGHIKINPYIFRSQPTVLKLFWYAHECGHSVVGLNESEADCWAIRNGKNQGWFQPQNFAQLERMFEHNPGDWTHLPGPQRVKRIKQCYGLDATNDDEDLRKKIKPIVVPSDSGRCASEYSACMSNDVTKPAECIDRQQRSCMRDCMSNYRYGEALCEARFCNANAGTNGSWRRHCNERVEEESRQCADHRETCQSREKRR